MKNQKLEEKIIAWFEGKLKEVNQRDFMSEVNASEDGKQLFETYRMIYKDLENEEMALPSADFKKKFHASLEEKNNEITNPVRTLNPSEIQIKNHRFQFFKYAAAVLLLVSVGILIGLNISKDNQLNQVSEELLAMKTEMKYLLQNESTAQRIRAVKMSNDFQEVDNEILNVLINTMNSDKSKNVRLAAIGALENFSHKKMVADAFLQTLKSSEEDFLQIKLIRILSEVKDKNALPYFDKIIDNKTTSKYLKTEATEGKKIINL